jgi:hypothetical protein
MGDIMAKSQRTAFIRVTGENMTKSGLYVYEKSSIEEMLKLWADSTTMTYWFIQHPADEEVSKTHYHIVIKFKNPMPFDAIKSKFPYGDIESAKNIKSSVQYLVHFNDKSKVQYSWEDVITNCTDMTPYKVQTDAQQEINIQSIMDKIDKGIIREYNQFTSIPIELWSKHKTRIENALTYYRERVCMDKNREIKVIFFSGDTGTGKTSFAKEYCDKLHKSYCISSSSNDPMQDYKGEDVIILDDLRDSDFKFTDLLKVLDNHTKSTVRSRYHNKAFIGDMIIITSFKPLSDWYFDISRESKEQLYRRIQEQYKFTPDKIYAFKYDNEHHKYIPNGTAPNIIIMKAREKAKMALNMFQAIGIEFSEDDKKRIDTAINDETDEYWEQLEINSHDVKNLFNIPTNSGN